MGLVVHHKSKRQELFSFKQKSPDNSELFFELILLVLNIWAILVTL